MAVAVLVLPAGRGSTTAAAGDRASSFAAVPAPGHPYNVLSNRDRVYVVTSSGNPEHVNASAKELLLTYTGRGRLLSRLPVPSTPTMGLFGLALGPDGRLYVGDMNGRVLRYRLTRNGPSQPQIFATVPPPFAYGNWPASMWNGIAFDRLGNLFVADNAARIWRIDPAGHPEVWFGDPRLGGVGPFGLAVGPDQRLYVAMGPSGGPEPSRWGHGLVWRLPLEPHPTASDLTLFHDFGCGDIGQCTVQQGIFAVGLAFGPSGRLYVCLGNLNTVAVLGRDGRVVDHLSSSLLNGPSGLAFLGDSLLVTNSDFNPTEHPDTWRVVRLPLRDSSPSVPTSAR